MIKKQTKIVATISDIKCDVDFLRKLYDAGVNVFRLNTAHQTPEITKLVVDNIRLVSDKIGILIDTKGPEIRTRLARGGDFLEDNSIVSIKYGSPNDVSTKETIFISHTNFISEIKDCKQILIDDGAIELEVIDKHETELICKVIFGGAIKKNKSINVPGASFSLPALTTKDKEYVKFCVDNNIDFIAHSFVRKKSDLKEIQDILDKFNSKVKIIAKIENKEGVDNIDDILDNCFGIMVARGDLAIEITAEEVPIVQKELILKAISKAKISITATQMLQSMIDNPRPTRAEVSDIANAIYDGSDAIMLSGESAFGKFPVESVKVMSRVAKKVEASKKPFRKHTDLIWNNDIHKYLAKTAIESCGELPVEAIFAATRSGSTPRLLSSFRPKVPIYAETFDTRVMRELSLVYGVFPSSICNSQKTTDELVEKASLDLLKQSCEFGSCLSKESLVVFIGSTPGKTDGADFIEIKAVKHFLD